MKHLNNASGQEFEVTFVKDFDITLITRWNSAEHEADLSPITLVGYYFGEYDKGATDTYINRWLAGNIKECKMLQIARKYLAAYLLTNEGVLDEPVAEEVTQTILNIDKTLSVIKLLTANDTTLRYEQLIDYRGWFDSLLGPAATTEQIDHLYETNITITVAGRSIDLSFDAENYNNIATVLRRAIEEF